MGREREREEAREVSAWHNGNVILCKFTEREKYSLGIIQAGVMAPV